MSETCAFPLCERIAQKNRLCILHRIYEADFPVKIIKAELKKINKVSEKMKTIKAELKKLYPVFLKKHPVCQLNTPDCKKKATCIHHTKGRGKNVLNQGTWMASCTPCNLWVETNHGQAEKAGLKLPQHQGEYKREK